MIETKERERKGRIERERKENPLGITLKI